MARKPAPATLNPKLKLTAREMQKGIDRLNERIKTITSFDLNLVRQRENPPAILALATDVQGVLEKTFGEGTSDLKRYESAFELPYVVHVWSDDFPAVSDFRSGIQGNLGRAKALLEQAVKSLEEDLKDVEEDSNTSAPIPLIAKLLPQPSRKIFIVHGRDEVEREKVATFLRKVDFIPIILHEQANRGHTIIEKFVANSDVEFAVVLLTPDDQGCEVGGTPQPRARQNVVLELGFFVGRLGRDRVLALRKGDVELPSDYAGVVYENLDNAGAWRTRLGQELEAAGFDIDWNKAMRP